MPTATPAPQATLDDLLKVGGKAELIGGRIVHLMPTGRIPNRVAGRVFRHLADYAERAGGEAYTDTMGFKIPQRLPGGRQSISPDVSFDFGPFPPDGMKFNDHPPVFAAEVRSEDDYGPAADREYEEKRADYFHGGTQVVWDVDPIARTVTKYTAADPANPAVFRRGDAADAEPALPGWRLPVDALFA